MHCFIKYIDYENFQIMESLSVSQMSSGMENKVLIVNPDCFIGIIMEYIFSKIGIFNEDRRKYDLATDRGKLLKVNSFPPDTSGLQILSNKAMYYVVCYDCDQMKPILNKSSKEFVEFIKKSKKSTYKKRTGVSRSSYDSSADSKSRRAEDRLKMFD